MPTSYWRQIPDVIEAMLSLRPVASVLELGIGCGKYGVLMREYLDVWDHYFEPWGTYHVRLEGIEIHEQYRGPAWSVYDEVRIGDASEIMRQIPDDSFDAVLIVDCLEHFEHDAGLALVHDMVRVAKKGVVIAVPESPGDTLEVWDNPHEIHRARFTIEDFERFASVDVRRKDDALVVVLT